MVNADVYITKRTLINAILIVAVFLNLALVEQFPSAVNAVLVFGHRIKKQHVEDFLLITHFAFHISILGTRLIALILIVIVVWLAWHLLRVPTVRLVFIVNVRNLNYLTLILINLMDLESILILVGLQVIVQRECWWALALLLTLNFVILFNYIAFVAVYPIREDILIHEGGFI